MTVLVSLCGESFVGAWSHDVEVHWSCDCFEGLRVRLNSKIRSNGSYPLLIEIVWWLKAIRIRIVDGIYACCYPVDADYKVGPLKIWFESLHNYTIEDDWIICNTRQLRVDRLLADVGICGQWHHSPPFRC
jgi:hypothetical protein